MSSAHQGFAHRLRRIALAILALLVPCGASAGIVALSGHVTSHLTGAPVAGVRVSIAIVLSMFGDANEIGAAYTDADGLYEWTGDCESVFQTCSVGVDDPPYLPAGGAFDQNIAVAVVDLALITPATVAGTVRFAEGDASGTTVTAAHFVDSSLVWEIVSYGDVGPDGTFVVGALPPDAYRVCTLPTQNGSVQQCFDHVDMPPLAVDPDATIVDVAEGSAVGNIDFDLVSGGTLSGTVYDAFLGAPLTAYPAQITAYDTNGQPLLTGETTTAGDYHLRGLPDGAFYLGANAPFFWDGIQFYPGIVCDANNCPPPTSGTLLTISGANEITGLDFTMHPAVVVQGRVFGADTGDGLGGVQVGLYESDGTELALSAPDTGAYTFYWYADKPFQVGAFLAPPHINTVYPGASCLRGMCVGEITPLQAATGSVLTGIDLPMALGAVISGRTLRADNGVAGDGYIDLYDAAFNDIWQGYTFESAYATDAWLPGTYYVEANGFYPLSGCAFYDDRPCPENGGDPAGVNPTPVTVVAGEIRTGVDFHLAPVDAIFAGDFDFEFGAPSTPAARGTRSP